MAVIYTLLTLLAINSIFCLFTEAFISHQNIRSVRHTSSINANPINSDGSKYRGDITEEEAFLWFDEAMVSTFFC